MTYLTNDYIWKEMEEIHADGVDFVSLECFLQSNNNIPQIYLSYSKKQWENETCIPKTGRKYWKIDSDGYKSYVG